MQLSKMKKKELYELVKLVQLSESAKGNRVFLLEAENEILRNKVEVLSGGALNVNCSLIAYQAIAEPRSQVEKMLGHLRNMTEAVIKAT